MGKTFIFRIDLAKEPNIPQSKFAEIHQKYIDGKSKVSVPDLKSKWGIE